MSRELDEFIEEHVFGTPKALIKALVNVPGWSSTGDGMLAVIEEMGRRNFWLNLEVGAHTSCAWFLSDAFGETPVAECPTAPEAVARAAMAALGGEAVSD